MSKWFRAIVQKIKTSERFRSTLSLWLKIWAVVGTLLIIFIISDIEKFVSDIEKFVYKRIEHRPKHITFWNWVGSFLFFTIITSFGVLVLIKVVKIVKMVILKMVKIIKVVFLQMSKWFKNIVEKTKTSNVLSELLKIWALAGPLLIIRYITSESLSEAVLIFAKLTIISCAVLLLVSMVFKVIVFLRRSKWFKNIAEKTKITIKRFRNMLLWYLRIWLVIVVIGTLIKDTLQDILFFSFLVMILYSGVWLMFKMVDLLQISKRFKTFMLLELLKIWAIVGIIGFYITIKLVSLRELSLEVPYLIEALLILSLISFSVLLLVFLAFKVIVFLLRSKWFKNIAEKTTPQWFKTIAEKTKTFKWFKIIVEKIKTTIKRFTRILLWCLRIGLVVGVLRILSKSGTPEDILFQTLLGMIMLFGFLWFVSELLDYYRLLRTGYNFLFSLTFRSVLLKVVHVYNSLLSLSFRSVLIITSVVCLSGVCLWLLFTAGVISNVFKQIEDISEIPINEIAEKGGSTPLHVRVQYRQIDKVKTLLAEGAGINATDKAGETPLHKAASINAVDMAKVLLNAGADVNARDSLGYTPLHNSSSKNAVDMAKVLLNENAVDMAKVLLNAGADVNAKDNYGETPLHKAASVNAVDVAKVLLTEFNAKDFFNENPLHALVMVAAVAVNNAEVLLLNEGADVNARDNNGKTPLHVAAFMNASDMAKVLLEKGADVNARDYSDDTPLHMAAQVASMNAVDTSKVLLAVDMAKVLLSEGADVNAKNKYGDTPLHVAEEVVDMAKVLLSEGADVNAKNNKDETP